jgi:cytochrome c oxidase subunit 3
MAAPVRAREVLDVSRLPAYAFGSRSEVSFGTAGFIAIEGMMFALLIASYLHLRARNTVWPMGVAPPDLLWGTLNLILLFVSAIPNQLAKKAGERLDLPKVQLWMSVCLLFGVVLLGIRLMEFRSLNVAWDTNAYGSLVWALLGFHAMHLVTDVGDTAVLAGVMFAGPLEESRFVDVSENAFYWYFVIAAWVPIYVVLYLVPRIS